MDKIFVPSRLVPLDGGVNFRDLGGYPTEDGQQVRWRKLFRCGHLTTLTQSDLDALQQLQVTHIHDFRRVEEQQRMPSKTLAVKTTADYNVHMGSLSQFWELLEKGKLSDDKVHALIVESYRDCHADVAPSYKRLFEGLLSNADQASLFHCAAGKDRTGLAAALILSALNVPRQTIIEDYLLTNEHFDYKPLLNIIENHLREANIQGWQRSWLLPYCSVNEENLLAFFAGLDDNYGGVDGYLELALGLSDAKRQQLQQFYLQPI